MTIAVKKDAKLDITFFEALSNSTVLLYFVPNILPRVVVAMGKENIQGIESGKSRVIYVKIKAEIDTLGTLKDCNKKAKENNRKSGSVPQFPPFCHDFDEVLSDRAVVKIAEVK